MVVDSKEKANTLSELVDGWGQEFADADAGAAVTRPKRGKAGAKQEAKPKDGPKEWSKLRGPR